MEYTPTNWITDATPVNAGNMNKIEAGLVDAKDGINGITDELLDYYDKTASDARYVRTVNSNPPDANGNVSTLSEGGEGTTDHGALFGLSDDDHPHYHNNARGDARYPRTVNSVAPDGSGNVVVDHGALTGLGDDDHAQYLNNTRGDARYVRTTNHTKAAHDALALDHASLTNLTTGDPHTQYLNQSRGDERYVQTGQAAAAVVTGEWSRTGTTQNHDGQGTWTGIEWNSEAADPGAWHDPVSTPRDFSLPAGTYSINASWSYPSNDAGYRAARLLVGGSAYGTDRKQTTGAASPNERSISWTLRLTGTTTVQVQSQQSVAAGHPIQIGATLVIAKIA